MTWAGSDYIRGLHAAVAQAYGMRCWLCGLPINPRYKHPHPQCFTADHVVARRDGGSDAISNLRPAHLQCNLRRGARSPHSVRTAARHPSVSDVF
ncbi:MAG: HNH endonuclease [Actinomyces sp.]|nr:HNH endonuclease [Actinomyces sp.]